MNKVYNIIVYSHILLHRLNNLFHEIDYRGTLEDAFDPSKNIIPKHLIDYLDEKSTKYVGLNYNEIDNVKLLSIMYGTVIVNPIDELLPVFESKWDSVSSEKFVDIQIMIEPFKEIRVIVAGLDYEVTRDFKDYLCFYDDYELRSTVRDLQLKTLIK